MRRLCIIACTLALASAGCDDDGSGPTGGTATGLPYELTNAFPGITFTNAIGFANAGDGSGRAFIVEQAGRIRVVDGATVSTFLDISIAVDDTGLEKGLLGLAFHPDYQSNGHFFVYYTASSGGLLGRLSRFTVSGDPAVADAGSEAVLLEVPQWATNHNGGALFFGTDDLLYLGLGDGGGSGDPQDNAQDPTNLLGTVIRLDVDTGAGAPPYHAVPADNPFVGNGEGWREEIYAYGLRNPWRASADPVTGTIHAGDVGQGAYEEIDVIESGGNYGWDCREGMHDYTGPSDPSPACATAGPFVEPIFEYPHSGGNRSITGGYVYRGPGHVDLVGRYIYADYVSGRIWALASDASSTEQIAQSPSTVSSFGVGEDGELYVVERGDPGRVYRLLEVAE